VPAYIAAGKDPKDVRSHMRRLALDDWLDEGITDGTVSVRDFYGAAS
jgi:hypothetical protein